MTRKKVKLAYITNDAARKATFKKRKKGLMKKVSELSTLCGIEACAIMYSPYDPEPEVWPSSAGVQRVISRFKKMPEMDQSKKMVNQEGFLRQRIIKAEEQLKKQVRENREKEMMQVMYRSLVGEGLHYMSMVDLNDLGWLVDKNIKDIDDQIKSLESPSPVMGGNMSNDGAANKTSTDQDGMQNQQWYMDLLKPNDHNMARNLETLPPYNNGAWPNFLFP